MESWEGGDKVMHAFSSLRQYLGTFSSAEHSGCDWLGCIQHGIRCVEERLWYGQGSKEERGSLTPVPKRGWAPAVNFRAASDRVSYCHFPFTFVSFIFTLRLCVLRGSMRPQCT